MTGTEVAKRTPMQNVLAEVASDNFIAKLENALPEKVSSQKFVSVTVTAIKQNPELITADKDSLFNSIVRCAQDGLMPDGREAALVIFKVRGQPKAQYMPMIGGYRKIAAKYGFSLVADVVREGDEFRFSKVPPRLEHVPAALGKERGEVVGAYAVALWPDGRLVTAPEVMRPDEIEKVRKVSRAATSEYGPWVQWWDRMAAKTVARRLFSQLPLGETDDLTQRVIAASDAEYDLPKPGPQMSEQEANLVAISRDLPEPPDEETHVREEPEAIDRPSEAQLNRIAQLVDAYEGDISVYLMGAFGVDSIEKLTDQQAGQTEIALARLVTAQQEAGGEVLEGEHTHPDDGPFSDLPQQQDAAAEGDEQAGLFEEPAEKPARRRRS